MGKILTRRDYRPGDIFDLGLQPRQAGEVPDRLRCRMATDDMGLAWSFLDDVTLAAVGGVEVLPQGLYAWALVAGGVRRAVYGALMAEARRAFALVAGQTVYATARADWPQAQALLRRLGFTRSAARVPCPAHAILYERVS